MNIGQLFQGMFKLTPNSEVKTLELKAGDIVKGIVLKLLSDQEAIININGVQVRAKMAAPLNSGQAAAFIVLPDSPDGVALLKAMPLSTAGITQQSLVDWLNIMGVKDTRENRMLLNNLLLAGRPVAKEEFARFSELLTGKPKEIPLGQWIEAGLTAAEKGLPIDAESVRALRQVMFGDAFHKLLQSFSTQVQNYLREGEANGNIQTAATSGNGSPQPPPLPELLRQIVDLSGRIVNFSANAPDAADSAMLQPAAEKQPQPHSAAGSPHNEPAGQNAVDPKASVPPPTNALPNQAQQSRPNDGQANTVQQHADGMPEGKKQQVQAQAAVTPHSVEVRADRAIPAAAAIDTDQAKRHEFVASRIPYNEPDLPLADNRIAPSKLPSEAQPMAQPHSHSWLPQLLKLVGVSFERDLRQAAWHHMLPNESEIGENLPPGIDGAGQSKPGSTEPVMRLSDSLKGLLMQLAGMEHSALPFHDTAQQLLNNITGQQLLLYAGNQQALSQITLFVPLHGVHGDQTAAVQIQSRRGKRGELDAQNCHLLFDLHMPALGDTVIDVQVINRLVSIQVFNDHPQISGWLEQSKDQIDAALIGLGYSCLSLKHRNFPPQHRQHGEEREHSPSPFPVSSMRPYKGVDYRI